MRSKTETDFDLGACDAAPCASHHQLQQYCNNGEKVVGGGVTWEGINQAEPPIFSNGGAVAISKSYPDATGDPQGWIVDLQSPTEDGATHLNATAYAVCAS